MKPTLLYVSPFPPQKSGISVYSVYMVQGLSQYFNITILSQIEKRELPNELQMFPYVQYKSSDNYADYDYIIYNFGNNPKFHGYMYNMLDRYPGYVIMHDFSLYYLTMGCYGERGLSKLYELHGASGVSTIKDAIGKNDYSSLTQIKTVAHKLPCNKEVLSRALGIIVHSLYAKEKVLEVIPNAKVLKIELIKMDDISYEDTKKKNIESIRNKWKLKTDDFVIVAAGMIAESKMNIETCEAVIRYNNDHPEKKVKYLMVGDGSCADKYLSKDVLKTGYVNDEEFFDCIIASDAVFNLRLLYNGESSATLIQALSLGKTTVVSPIGWFDELSEDVVVKLAKNDVESIAEVIEKIRNISVENKKGIDFIKNNCEKEIVSKHIYDFVIGN